MSKGEIVYLEDSDTLVMIAKTPLSVTDPTDEFPYVSQSFRVVADRIGPTLALVPLCDSPISVPREEVEEHNNRRFEEKLKIASDYILSQNAQGGS